MERHLDIAQRRAVAIASVLAGTLILCLGCERKTTVYENGRRSEPAYIHRDRDDHSRYDRDRFDRHDDWDRWERVHR